jgi:hypothetical protein
MLSVPHMASNKAQVLARHPDLTLYLMKIILWDSSASARRR